MIQVFPLMYQESYLQISFKKDIYLSYTTQTKND